MTDNKCIGFTVNGNKCGYKATIGNCCSKHYDVYGTDKIVAEVGSDKYNSLLIIKSPHLIKEWDFEKNKLVDFYKKILKTKPVIETGTARTLKPAPEYIS